MTATQLRHTSIARINWRGALDFDTLDRRGRDPSHAVAEFETQAFYNPADFQSTASKGCTRQRDDGRFWKHATINHNQSLGGVEDHQTIRRVSRLHYESDSRLEVRDREAATFGRAEGESIKSAAARK